MRHNSQVTKSSSSLIDEKNTSFKIRLLKLDYPKNKSWEKTKNIAYWKSPFHTNTLSITTRTTHIHIHHTLPQSRIKKDIPQFFSSYNLPPSTLFLLHFHFYFPSHKNINKDVQNLFELKNKMTKIMKKEKKRNKRRWTTDEKKGPFHQSSFVHTQTKTRILIKSIQIN